MNRPWIAIVVTLLVALAVLRLSPWGAENEPVAPGPSAAGPAPPGPTDLVPPDPAGEGRGAAAAEAVTAAPPDGSDAGAPEEELPLLLSGLVIDGGGVGVPEATVDVERHVADTGGFGMRMVEILPLHELTTRTRDDGRFEVRGAAQGEVVVRASKKGCVLREQVTCELPATKVTLVLERGGALEVTVAPSALELAQGVVVEVRPPGGERDVRGESSSFREGRAVRGALLPGPCDVALVGRVSRRVLHVVAGVQVRAGETTRDPRLQGLDLGAWMRQVRVTVVDPDELPVRGATVWVHHGFGEVGVSTAADGSIELVAGEDGVDVALREVGWRAVRHTAVTEDLVVRLERPLALRLVRPPGRSTDLGDLYLYVARIPSEDEPAPQGGNNDWTLSARLNAVEVGLDGPGTYQVQWAATLPLPGGGSANLYPRDVTPQEIEVAEDAGTQEVVLELDPAAVDELRGRLAALAADLERQPGETDDEHARRIMQVILRGN